MLGFGGVGGSGLTVSGGGGLTVSRGSGSSSIFLSASSELSDVECEMLRLGGAGGGGGLTVSGENSCSLIILSVSSELGDVDCEMLGFGGAGGGGGLTVSGRGGLTVSGGVCVVSSETLEGLLLEETRGFSCCLGFLLSSDKGFLEPGADDASNRSSKSRSGACPDSDVLLLAEWRGETLSGDDLLYNGGLGSGSDCFCCTADTIAFTDLCDEEVKAFLRGWYFGGVWHGDEPGEGKLTALAYASAEGGGGLTGAPPSMQPELTVMPVGGGGLGGGSVTPAKEILLPAFVRGTAGGRLLYKPSLVLHGLELTGGLGGLGFCGIAGFISQDSTELSERIQQLHLTNTLL